MSHPKPWQFHVFSSRSAGLVLLLAVALMSFISKADTPPQFAFSIGSNQVPGGFWPTAVGADLLGKVYISSQWHVIQVDTNGTFLNQWGTQGSGPGQFSYAGQTAFDNAGHVFVLDGYNYRVEEFDTDGHFITAWGSQGDQPGQFDGPYGLAVSRSGRIYVSDGNNFRVQVFSSPGVFLKQFGTIGTNAGQFTFPEELAVDSSNNVYVLDVPGGSFDNYRVQKFDGDGNFLLQWGAHGSNLSASIQLGGIATDSANNVYVADAANNRVQKFSSDGLFLSQWGSSGTGPGQFNDPLGIAIDPTDNYVYVGDYYNARVNVFAYSPLAPLIYQPPTNQIVPAGSTLSLAAAVFGAQPIGYRWQFNGSDIPGATAAVLTISNVSLAASGTYSVSASNSLGSAFSPNATITVLPAVVTTLPVSGITATSAVLYGSFWVGNNPTTGWFEWGTNTTTYGNVSGLTNLNLNSSRAVSYRLSDLDGEVVYHYRAAASNDLGVVYGQDLSFQVGFKPTVVTLPVVSSVPGTVLLSASVNPEARNTSVYFRWGRYSPSQYVTATNQVPSLTTPVTVQNQITGLVAGVIYAVQAVASNDAGVVLGTIVNFVAPPWTLLPVPLQQTWISLATSADGSKLAAATESSRIYLSADTGMSWTSSILPNLSWPALTMSADGSRLVAVPTRQPGLAYLSTNFGKSWLPSHGPNRNWNALASSGDGVRLAGFDPIAPFVLTSINAGLDWQTNSPGVSAHWTSIASSADGQRLIIAAAGTALSPTNGPVFTSADAGASWISNSLPLTNWQSVASSANGQVLLAAVGGLRSGPIYISTNAGSTWSLTAAPVTNWQKVVLSADATTLIALARIAATPVFTSTNLGLSWQPAVLPQAIWSDVVISADGARLFASGDQNIVSRQTIPTPALEMSVAQGNLSLSWVIPSVPFTLQRSADLSFQQWTNLPITPVASATNLHYQVTLPATGQSGFFRLRGSD